LVCFTKRIRGGSRGGGRGGGYVWTTPGNWAVNERKKKKIKEGTVMGATLKVEKRKGNAVKHKKSVEKRTKSGRKTQTGDSKRQRNEGSLVSTRGDKIRRSAQGGEGKSLKSR